MGERLRLDQAVIVEGKYDKIRLEALVDALILPTNGFGIFKDSELKAFIRRLAEERGIVVLTDSDGAGFKIRGYLSGLLPPEQVRHVYIPDLFGKEKRKAAPSAEGKLGVEGMEPGTLRAAFAKAGITAVVGPEKGDPVTRQDLYDSGFTGGADSRALRYALCDRLALPRRLNATALLTMLNSMLTREEFLDLAAEMVGEVSLPE